MKANKMVLAAAMLGGVLVSAGSATARSSTPAGWTDDCDAALARAAAEKKLVVADFSGSDWCGWCKKLDREVFGTDEFLAGATNKYVLLMVDSPSDKTLLSEKAREQNPKLVKKYGVRGFPTVLVLDAKGEVVLETGYRKGGPAKYLAMLDEEIRVAPEVKKHIKPLENDLDGQRDALQRAFSSAMSKLKKKDQTEEERKLLVGKVLRDEIAPKLLPAYEQAIAKAKAVSVPASMETRKQELIASHENTVKWIKNQIAQQHD